MNKYFILLLISISLVDISSVNAIPATDAQNLTNLPPLTKLVDGWHFKNDNLLSYNNKINESVTGTITSAIDKWGNASQALSTKSNSCGRWNITSVDLANFTICAWVDDVDTGTAPISSLDRYALSNYYSQRAFYNYDGLYIADFMDYGASSGGGIPTYNQYTGWASWHFYCATYRRNNADGIRMYIDNVQVAADNAMSIPDSNFNITHFIMGCRATNGATYHVSSSNSYIDEVTIWNDVLNSTQLSALYYTYDNWDYVASTPYVNVSLSTPNDNDQIIRGLNNFTFYINATSLSKCELYNNITSWSIKDTLTYPNNLTNQANNTFTNINITESGVWNVKCFSADNTISAYAPSNYTFLIGATSARNIFGFITPNTQVRLLNPQTLVSTYATSNATGYFTFNDLAVGNYIVYTYSRTDYNKIPEVKYVQIQ